MWVRGTCAALSSVSIGIAALIVVILGVWAADSRSGASAGSAIRVALQVWLVAHRAPVRVPGGTLAMAPLGLTVLLMIVLARAATVVARGSRCSTARDVGSVVLAVAGPYTVAVTIVSLVAGQGAIRPEPIPSLVAGAVVAGLAATAGGLRGSGLTRRWWSELPADARAALDAGVAAIIVLAAFAVLFVVIAVGTHLHQERVELRGGGAPGAITLVLLCVLLLPNAASYALGYLTGPGYALGSGTSVSLGGAHLGALPAVPLVAATPHGAAPTSLVIVAVLGVLLAGVVAAWRVTRQPITGLVWRIGSVAGGGAVAGLLAAIAVGVADGPTGPGRLATVGSSPWQVGLVVVGEVAVAGALTLVAVSIRPWLRSARLPTWHPSWPPTAWIRSVRSELDDHRGDDLVREGLPFGVPQRPQPADEAGE